MTTEERFVDIALTHVGCHYIWGGKGQLIVTAQGLKKHGFTDLSELHLPLDVFDCSGLVTVSLFQATQGKMNGMATASAQVIFDTWPIAKSEEDGVLRLYPGHVAISLGRGRVVEAAGGDHTTTSVLAAVERGAKVRVGSDLRLESTLLGLRRIPLDKSELRSV